MGTPLRILIVEDSEDDTLLLVRALRRGGYEATFERVETAAGMAGALAQQTWDIVISDYAMPHFSAPAALALLQGSGLDLPFIILSGVIGEETAVEAMKAGAHDYIRKGSLARLIPAIERELRDAEVRRERRRAEEALRESEERYRTIFDHAADGLVRIDRSGVVTDINQRLAEMLGLQVEGYVGKRFLTLGRHFPRKSFGIVLKRFAERMAGKELAPYEVQIRRVDGSLIDVEINARPVKREGKITGEIIAIRDIMQRKRVRRLLQALNEAARSMEQALTPEEICVTIAEKFATLGFICIVLFTDEDQKGLVVKHVSIEEKVVKAAERLTGLKMESFVIPIKSVDVYRKVVWERKSCLAESIEDVMQQMLPRHVKRFAAQLVRIVNIPKAVLAPLIVDDRVLGVLSVHSDDLTAGDTPTVTAFAHQMAAALRKARLMQGLESSLAERKRAQEALRESEAKYRAIFEQSTDAIYVTTREGRFVDLNQAGLDLFGYTRKELERVNVRELCADPADRSGFQQEIEQKGFIRDFEVKLRKKDGTEMDCLLSSTVQRDGDGTILGYQGIIRDLTERKRLEQHMRQQDRLASLGQLAGGIAHDFNNVLMTIILYTEMVLGESSLPQDLAPDLECVLDEAQEAARLVRQVLDFSRRSPIETRLVDMRAFTQESVGILQRTLPETVHFLLEVGPGEYVVDADPTRVQQVLMNLVVNARDAMPEGGELRISLSRVEVGPGEEPPRLGQRPSPNGEWVCLAVSDTGTGIPPEVLPRIFEPFFTTRPKGEGTGLGLAQVYGIVKQHGGHVGVETEVGQGTTFRVYLPAQRATEVEEAPLEEPAAAAVGGKGETILVAEDEERVRDLSRRILESLGYRVLTAENGRKALEVYRSAESACPEQGRRVDLLLTDMIMPEMGGKELIRELRKVDPHLRAVAMTGYVLAEDLRQLKEEGSLEVVQKPLDTDTLARIVRQTLDSG